MKCSRCGELVSPVVCLDIDGTLGDYHKHFQEFAENWLDVHLTGCNRTWYIGEGKYSEWFRRVYGVDLTTFRAIKLAYRQGGMKRTMPAYPGAAVLASGIRAEGAELWLTTTRPYLSLDGIDRDTREWLSRNNIEYDRLLYDENKYELVHERVDDERVVAVLDDELEQCERARAIWGRAIPIMRGIPANEGTDFFPKVGTLETARRMICDRIAEWRQLHDG